MLHIKTQFSPVLFLPISLKSPQCNNQEQTHVLEHSLASVNLSCIVDLFPVLHELASARACTLLKLAPSVHATLKPKGNTPKSYFPQELVRILRFHFSVLRILLNKHMGFNWMKKVCFHESSSANSGIALNKQLIPSMNNCQMVYKPFYHAREIETILKIVFWMFLQSEISKI